MLSPWVSQARSPSKHSRARSIASCRVSAGGAVRAAPSRKRTQQHRPPSEPCEPRTSQEAKSGGKSSAVEGILWFPVARDGGTLGGPPGWNRSVKRPQGWFRGFGRLRGGGCAVSPLARPRVVMPGGRLLPTLRNQLNPAVPPSGGSLGSGSTAERVHLVGNRWPSPSRAGQLRVALIQPAASRAPSTSSVGSPFANPRHPLR